MWKIFALLFCTIILVVLPRLSSAEVIYQDVYRFWSDKYQKHFFTIDQSEKQDVENSYSDYEWKYEGIAFQAVSFTGNCPDGFDSVHRFWNIKRGGHFYTISTAEKDDVLNRFGDTWQYEQVAFCAGTAANEELNPVYRFWSQTKDGHFFTLNAAEKTYIDANYPRQTWQYEKVAFYAKGDPGIVVPQPVAYQCPSFTQSCIPCNAGEQYCRVVAGQTTGFKGWSCQNNNPGNIRFSDMRNELIADNGGVPACGERGGFMVFRDYQTGRNSLKSYLTAISLGQHDAYTGCGNCSLKFFFSKYAPSSDGNNPDAYALDVASRIGVNADTTTLSWIVANKLDQFVDAIQIHEGWFSYQ